MLRHARTVIVVLGVVSATAPGAVAQPADSEEAARIREAAVVLDEIMAAADSGIPDSILSGAEGIAIFPATISGGFIVGGMRGRGVLTARTEDGWSPPSFMTLTGGSFGLQIGGQSTDIILVIQNRRGLETFLGNQFKLGGDASVAGGPVGRKAQASTDLQLRAEILSYSRSRGLFAGVALDGSTVLADVDANERFYGERLDARQVVIEQRTAAPEPVPVLQQTLAKYATR